MSGKKPITIIVSDLHLGGGKNDPGDDHVYQEREFANFLEKEIPESQKGSVELFINGDFLEFAQVLPDVYGLGSDKYWCSENESVSKVDEIICGHREIFEALMEFKKRGNIITMAAGNHDVDLWWPEVQKRIIAKVGEIQFALGEEWYNRYENRLLISHGHMIDPANKFKHWDNPILQVKGGPPRLEMCPGTLFMVKFLNGLEKNYPFADNLKPLMMLARLLYTERRPDFKAAVWTLLKLAGENPVSFLGTADEEAITSLEIGEDVLSEVDLNDSFAQEIADLYHELGRPQANIEMVRKDLRAEEDVYNFLKQLILRVSPERWEHLFDNVEGLNLGIDGTNQSEADGENGDEAVILSSIRSGMANEKEALREDAEYLFEGSAAEVVVCGHTHQPDEWRGSNGTWDGGYFNPGSWTRYVDASKAAKLTLKDLQNEADFPYELNYVRVEEGSTGRLRADKIRYKYLDSKWSK
jgi:UDP-2,3-diacylglucosamine pyrophosphatase LpxH